MKPILQWLRRMFAGQRPDEVRLQMLEQRDQASRSQAAVALERAERELAASRLAAAAKGFSRADDALRRR